MECDLLCVAAGCHARLAYLTLIVLLASMISSTRAPAALELCHGCRDSARLTNAAMHYPKSVCNRTSQALSNSAFCRVRRKRAKETCLASKRKEGLSSAERSYGKRPHFAQIWHAIVRDERHQFD